MSSTSGDNIVIEDVEARDPIAPRYKTNSVDSICWQNVVVSTKGRKSKTILDNAQGLATRGELIAIIGPSYVHRVFSGLAVDNTQRSWKISIAFNACETVTAIENDRFRLYQRASCGRQSNSQNFCVCGARGRSDWESNSKRNAEICPSSGRRTRGS